MRRRTRQCPDSAEAASRPAAEPGGTRRESSSHNSSDRALLPRSASGSYFIGLFVTKGGRFSILFSHNKTDLVQLRTIHYIFWNIFADTGKTMPVKVGP